MRVLKSLEGGRSHDPEEAGQSLSIKEFASHGVTRGSLGPAHRDRAAGRHRRNQGIPQPSCFTLEGRGPDLGHSETADSSSPACLVGLSFEDLAEGSFLASAGSRTGFLWVLSARRH